MHPRFGTAGAGDLFYTKGYKHSHQVPVFLGEMGLTAFEYQCGRGVRISQEKANLLGAQAKLHNVALSIHAPYYISLGVAEEEKRQNNLRYFLECARAARAMGALRVVFHPGSAGKGQRGEAFAGARENLEAILDELDCQGYGDILFCPETMGKINQLGDLEEVLRFCGLRENLLPCIDFGHLNARTQGGVNNFEAFDGVFRQIADALGEEKAKVVHCHFSKIEYGKGGEKRHLTFADDLYGPDYQPLMELLAKKAYAPTIICESAGTQAEDAKAMAEDYFAWAKSGGVKT